VTGVLTRRGRVRELLELWASTLLFNLVGVALFAWLASRDGVLGDHARIYMKELARTKVDPTFWPSFMKAIFAGWLMTVLTWLMLAARGLGPRLFIIYLVGFLISAGEFNHVVISSAEVFMGILLGAPVGLGGWFLRTFLPGLTGNLVGGVLFVTLLGTVQARTLRESEDRLRRAAELG
jgi:formate-nitrite transporter family protein